MPTRYRPAIPLPGVDALRSGSGDTEPARRLPRRGLHPLSGIARAGSSTRVRREREKTERARWRARLVEAAAAAMRKTLVLEAWATPGQHLQSQAAISAWVETQISFEDTVGAAHRAGISIRDIASACRGGDPTTDRGELLRRIQHIVTSQNWEPVQTADDRGLLVSQDSSSLTDADEQR